VGRAGTRALSVSGIQNPLTRNGETSRTTIAAAHEFFIQDTDSTCREITINRTYVDFGYTPYLTQSDAEIVVMFNGTSGKVAVVWQIPKTKGGEEGGNRNDVNHDKPAFSVFPDTAEISPGQKYTFKITFLASQSNRNFMNELEAFVFFKSQRTFRLVVVYIWVCRVYMYLYIYIYVFIYILVYIYIYIDTWRYRYTYIHIFFKSQRTFR
jgi:hypothetical protein